MNQPQQIIVYRSVNDLIPYARNSRTHSEEQVLQIASSIKEFGFTNPVLIDHDGGIIAGHGRVMAARKVGIDQVPTIELAHLTETQKRAYIIADNKMALNAGWDNELLAVEFAELSNEGFDLSLTGFDDDEIAGLTPQECNEGLTDPDAVPEVQDDPITKMGDIWLLGDHRLMCGDSTSMDAVDTLMDGGKADMVFTDPPYGVDYEGINNDSREGLRDLLMQAFSNYTLAANPGAPVYCFHSDRCADIFHEVFRQYCHFSSMVIWVKPSLVLSQTDYQSRHEPCIYGWIEGGSHPWNADRKQTSIWEFGKESVAGHTTPKPVELVSYAIQNSSKPKQIILDLFGGSGSTLIACEKSGRYARLMELDHKYCDVIIKRWQDFTGEEAIHAESGETFNSMVAN